MGSFSRIKRSAILFFVALTCAAALSGSARPQNRESQSGAAGGGATPAPSASPSAKALFEDADGYLRRKFDEFASKDIPYSGELDARTRNEQKALAARHVAALRARGNLGVDLYYLGLLHALAGDAHASLETMRRFLAEQANAPAEFRQKARSVLVRLAIEQKRISEAESVLADYSREQPRSPTEMHRLNAMLASHYNSIKEFDRSAVHARATFDTAKQLARGKTLSIRQRADTAYAAGKFLADVLVKARQRNEAVRVINEMRRLALELPSARLSGSSTALLLSNGVPLETVSDFAPEGTAPEISAVRWIDKSPSKLADLRGQVVLLDFWATWCGPCRYTIPKLNALHEKYEDRGLVILGLTKFYRTVEGRDLTPDEELSYLRRFKKQRQVEYGFAIDDSDANETGYGVTQMPTAVLIDRRGRVRFITTTATDVESKAMISMVEILLREQ
jgi:thiol-disulfide isomerase/thioredoxin